MSDPQPAPVVTLEWVEEPRVEDGRVVYTYRNAGDAVAAVVSEQIHAGEESQLFQREDVAPGAEETTRAPFGHDVPAGAAYVWVSITAAAAGATEWGPTLDARVEAHGANGILTAGPAPEQAAAAAFSSIDVTDVEVHDDEVLVAYVVDGGPDHPHVGFTAYLVHGDDMRWTGAEFESNERAGLLRVGVPFELVEDEGWALLATISAMDPNSGAGIMGELKVQLAYEDGKARYAGHGLVLRYPS